MNIGATEAIARFVHGLRFEDLPEAVAQQAKFVLLDTVACSLAGVPTRIGRLLAAYVQSLGGRAEATLLGLGGRSTAENAALLNGATARCLEMDDTHAPSGMHLGSVVVPAALAMAERGGASGKELLTAIVLGYEVALKVGMSMMPSVSQRGFHPTGVCGILGAAVAAGRLLGLDEEDYRHVLGTAATSASGLFQFEVEGAEGFMSGVLNAGRAASMGVASARLTALGYLGTRHVLEGERGFARAFGSDVNVAVLAQDLGAPFALERVDFTLFACCRHSRSAVEAVLTLLEETGMGPEDTQMIQVCTYRGATAESCRRQTLVTEYDALLSIPYAVAVACHRGKITPAEYEEAVLRDPSINALKQRVLVQEDGALSGRYPERSPARVVLHTRQGESFARQVEAPKGSWGNPLSLAERQGKLRGFAAGLLAPAQAEEAIRFILHLEAQSSVGGLFPLLSGQPQAVP